MVSEKTAMEKKTKTALRTSEATIEKLKKERKDEKMLLAFSSTVDTIDEFDSIFGLNSTTKASAVENELGDGGNGVNKNIDNNKNDE